MELANLEDISGKAAFEKGIFPSLAALIPPPLQESTFRWKFAPPGGTYCGTIFTDGSRIDGNADPRLGRNGWAFVVKNATGRKLASASGVPPPWINDIPGIEA